jgi:hypothetical protein
MKKILHVSFLAVMLLLSGCALKKEVISSQPYVVTVKTPSIAISDTGFLNRGKNYANVQIFSAGNILFNLEMMGDYICLDGRCLDKLSFNKQFFGYEHYADLMQDILNKEPIYHGLHLQKTAGGFVQTIASEDTQIDYRVENDTLVFKDTKNHLLIRFKPLP